MRKVIKNNEWQMTVLFGLLSLLSYILLFAYQDIITEYTTKGGQYATLPILFAFFFSLVHGAFASNVLHALKIKPAMNKD